ncbi:transposable element Tc1 transposase [Trichonephila clavipes]|uniref:Transposable element Tc1 transposase n=1 Tax=Trichonephila clavipes TaxID=2585209 RepID=A0A8X6V2X6_TRICX|nr:transposable element Tc1 transposase [Trichonephila clavipes]
MRLSEGESNARSVGVSWVSKEAVFVHTQWRYFAFVFAIIITLARAVLRRLLQGFGSPVVKVSDHGKHDMSSSPVPLKTCRVGQRCTLNLRVQTSSRWCSVVVRRGGASTGVVHVTRPWFKMTWSVAKSPRVAEQCGVNIHSFFADSCTSLITTLRLFLSDTIFSEGNLQPKDFRDQTEIVLNSLTNCNLLHFVLTLLRWTTSGCFYRGRIIGKLEEGRSVTSVAAEFGIAHSIVSRLWRQFQTTGTAIQGFSSGRPRGTTPADDRYIVLQARRNRRQTAGEIARHTTQATGRPISRFTVARRLHGGGLFARCPVRCVPLTPAHRRRRSLWCREHRNWRDNEWGRVLFTDESRFSLSSDSHCILIWRERGSRNHPSNIIERDRYGGRGVLVWGGIMLGSRTDLHIFDAGSVNGTLYCNEILLPYVRLFRGAMGLQFLFMDDNAPCHRTVAAEQLLDSRRLAARTLPPVTIRELRLALQDEWAAMPQQLSLTPSFSAWADAVKPA